MVTGLAAYLLPPVSFLSAIGVLSLPGVPDSQCSLADLDVADWPVNEHWFISAYLVEFKYML